MTSKLEELKSLREQLNIELNGIENYRIGEPNLLISNHNCLMDIFYLPSVIPEDIVSLISSRLVYKKEMERKKMVDKYLNAMPIEAHGGRIYSSMCLKHAVDILCNNVSLNIFPEGAYVEEDIIYRGRTGASRILYFAKQQGLNPNLIPVSIDIKDEIKDLDNFYPNDDKVVINILEPINYENAYYKFINGTDIEQRREALHIPIDEGMKKIADSMNKEYVNKYIELRPKKNVIFSDGTTLDTMVAQSIYYVYMYYQSLQNKSNKLVKTLR